MKTRNPRNLGSKLLVGVAMICLLLVGTTSFASPVATPYSKVAQEILKILKDQTVITRLSENGQRAIVSIERYGNLYKVATSNCVLDVNVIRVSAPIAPGNPVPEAIQLEVSYPTCLPGGISVGNH